MLHCLLIVSATEFTRSHSSRPFPPYRISTNFEFGNKNTEQKLRDVTNQKPNVKKNKNCRQSDTDRAHCLYRIPKRSQWLAFVALSATRSPFLLQKFRPSGLALQHCKQSVLLHTGKSHFLQNIGMSSVPTNRRRD